MLNRPLQLAAILVGAVSAHAGDAPWAHGPTTGATRVASFNIWDFRELPDDSGAPSDRARRLASVIGALAPDILLLNEVFVAPDAGGALITSAQTIVSLMPGGEGAYDLFVAPVNTGIHSGLDLNNDGVVSAEPGTREYAEDCFGYAEFPGRYAMALVVRRDAGSIDHAGARTFQTMLWSAMPGALLPPREVGPGGEEIGAWFDDDELRAVRLSSKSHWDVPVRLAGGGVLHILASHPTPPVFDGPEDRNGRRNHDEVRFWADYLSGPERGSYIVDDRGRRGGLPDGADSVLLGDLNADPDKGDGRRDAIRALLAHPRVARAVPAASGERAVIDARPDGAALRRVVGPTDTAMFGLRADYALPAATLTTLRAGIVRSEPPDAPAHAAKDDADGPWWLGLFPSDHFPVYVDVLIHPETTRTDR